MILPSSPQSAPDLARFEGFCRYVGLELEDFQRGVLAEFFAGRRELLVMLPRGNGKTTLFSALALFHLLTTPSQPSTAQPPAEIRRGCCSRPPATWPPRTPRSTGA